MKPLAGVGTTPKSNIGGQMTGGFNLGSQGDNNLLKPLVSILPGDSKFTQPLGGGGVPNQQESFFQKKKREEIERLE
jgi:hypothetical protein